MPQNKIIFTLILVSSIIICIFFEKFESYLNSRVIFNEAEVSDLNLILREEAKSILNKKDQEGGFATAVSLTAQCGEGAPVSFAAGTNAIHDLTPVTENSIFQIGSITKSFISIIILQIANKNKISLDDDSILSQWFPEYPKWRRITLRQLMNMTSGIPGNGNNLSDDIFKEFTKKQYTNNITPQKILDLTYKLPMHFKPGKKFEYSNTNYTLLGLFIQRVTHNSIEEELNKRILMPLKLNNTYYVHDKEGDLININKKLLVQGYAFQIKNSHPYSFLMPGDNTLPYSLSYTNTAGAIISTPEDINTYLHAIFNSSGLFYKYKKSLLTFVSKKTGITIKNPSITDREGFGLGVIGYYWNKEDPVIYLYNGATDGFNFGWIIDPKTNIYFIFAINSRADILNLNDALKLFTKVKSNCQSNSWKQIFNF